MSNRWKGALVALCFSWIAILFEVKDTMQSGEPGGFALFLRDLGETTPGGWLRKTVTIAVIVLVIRKRANLSRWRNELLD